MTSIKNAALQGSTPPVFIEKMTQDKFLSIKERASLIENTLKRRFPNPKNGKNTLIPKKIDPYFFHSMTLPGMTNLPLCSIDLIPTIKKQIESIKIKDHETTIDTSIKTPQFILSIFEAIGSIFITFMTIPYYLRSFITTITIFNINDNFLLKIYNKISEIFLKIHISSTLVSTLAKITIALGFIITFIEGIFESINLYRFINFSKNPLLEIQSFIEKLKNCKTLDEQKQFIDKTVEDLNKKKSSLVKYEGFVGFNNHLKLLKSFRNDLEFLIKLKDCKTSNEQTLLVEQTIKDLKEKQSSFIGTLGSTGFNNHLKVVESFKNECKLQKDTLLPIPSPIETTNFEYNIIAELLNSFKHSNLESKPEQVEKILSSDKTINIDTAKTQSKNTQIETLAKRINPWAVKEVQDKIQSIIDDLQSKDPSRQKNALERTNKLISLINIQNKKHIIVTIFSLIVIAITIVALIFTLILLLNPTLLPAGLVLIANFFYWTSFALSVAKPFISRGWTENDGWGFSIKKSLPESVLKMPETIHKIIFEKIPAIVKKIFPNNTNIQPTNNSL